jgi:RNA recognition motif-containing protein
MESYGTVLRSAIITDAAGRPKGFGVVEFALPTQAARAVHAVLKCQEVRTVH